DFTIFWIGQLISLTGTWIQTVAQQWLVLKLTGSPFDLGLLVAVQFTPLLLLSLIGGAITDRVSKRNLLLLTQVINLFLALALGLLVSTGVVRFWHVLVFAALLGTVNAFYTPARQSFVADLVDRDSLLNAVALNSTLFNGARVIGPAIGGLLVANLGLALNFYLNAASFVAVIVGLLLIAARPVTQTSERQSIARNVGEGLRFIADSPSVYTILALVGVASLFAFNFTTLIPVVADNVLHVGSSGFGFLMAAMGTGSLIGAISLAFMNRSDMTRRFIYTGAFVFTVTEIFFGLSKSYGLSLALLVLVGLASNFFTTTANTTVLSSTPRNLQGRVMSVYSLLFLGVTPFGSLLSGFIAQRWGTPVALVGGAVITVIFTLAVFIYRPTRRRRPPAERAYAT
ncbi:MAG: MFS transporter, partial [Chloroflexota bacterium]